MFRHRPAPFPPGLPQHPSSAFLVAWPPDRHMHTQIQLSRSSCPLLFQQKGELSTPVSCDEDDRAVVATAGACQSLGTGGLPACSLGHHKDVEVMAKKDTVAHGLAESRNKGMTLPTNYTLI